MRILQVSPSDRGGGAEAIALQLFRAYRDRGHKSWLAVGLKQDNDPDILAIPNHAFRTPWARAWFSIGEVAASTLEGRIRGAGLLRRSVRLGIGQPRRWLALRQGTEDLEFPGTRALLTLPSESPDLLNCHNLHASWLPDGGYFDLRMLPWLSRQLPVVLTLHDAWVLSGHCAHSFDCERWKTGCGQCPDLNIYPAVPRDATDSNWKRKKEIFSRSHIYLVAPSQWLMDKATHSLLTSAIVRDRIIHNGIDLTFFHPGDQREARANLNFPQKAFVILFVATDVRRNIWKDYNAMQAAIASVAEHVSEQPLLFIILGCGGRPERIGKAEIRFIPYQKDPATVACYYRAADVYLHAALVDTFPSAILEAMACGTPVVATAVGGIPEQVNDEETGFLVPSGDHQALAARLRQLLSDESLRRAMGAEAARVARQRFSLERQTDSYLQWYQEILDHLRSTGNTPGRSSTVTPEICK